jgi:CHAT domain-containing protein
MGGSMISPRGRIVLLVLLLASCPVFYALPLLHSDPQAPRPAPAPPPKAQAAPRPPLQDPQDRSPRWIGAGERHLYQFDLKPGEFVLFVVEQEGVDLQVDVLDRAGKLLFRVDGLNWTWGPEPVPLLAEADGLFDVRISGGEGSYRVRIDRRRPATPADRAWTAGTHAYWKGRDLLKRGAPGNQIEESFREAAREWERAGHIAGQADALCKLGDLYKSRRKSEALAMYLESLPLLQKTENRFQEIMVRNEIGSIYEELRQSATAEAFFREALDLAEENRFSKGKATSLIHLAHLLKGRGDLTEALGLFLQAFDLLQSSNQELVKTANKIGRLYMDLGRIEEARKYHDLALKILRRLNLPEEEAATWTHFGDLQLINKNYPIAAALYKRSLNQYEDLGDDVSDAVTSNKATALNNLGYTYYSMNELRKAADAFREALFLYTRLNKPQWQAVALTNMAKALDSLGKPPQALDAYTKALEIAERSNYPWGKVAAYFGMAWAERHRGNLIAAQQRLEEALEIIEDLRNRIQKPELKSSFLSRMQDVYALHVRILMDLHSRQPGAGFDLEALTASEKARARSLYDDLSGRIEPPPLSVRDMQQMLDSDTVLLEYFLDDGQSYVFVVTPGSFARYELRGREVLEPLARSLYRNIKASHKRENFPKALQDACRMSRELLGPVAGKIGRRRIVVVVPPSLQYVPFAALPVVFSASCAPNDSRRWPEPLIFRNEVVQVPSLAVLAALRNRISGRKVAPDLLAVLADPVFGSLDDRLARGAAAGDEEADARLPRLLYTREEARVILGALPGERKLLFLGFDATRDLAMAGRLSSFRILHFATHGRPNLEVPASSAVVLSRYDAQGRRRDGRLQARDIESLDLSADLVVLSACGTALGQEIPGEGLVGLTQAFFSAGAPRVVVTLWNVGDRSSVRLMQTFYTGLWSDGPAAALRRAQVEMWRSQTWNAPSFWAGFVLQGDWRKPR